MGTGGTVYVKPSGQEGDYTTLDGAIDGEAGTLASPLNIIIDGDWTSAEDTAAVVITGYDTSEANYINIYTTSSARHTGIYSTSKYVLAVTGSEAIKTYEDFIRIDGLQITKGTDEAQGIVNLNSAGSGSVIYISNSLIRGLGGSAYSYYGVYIGNANINLYMWNCVVYAITTNASAGSCALYQVNSASVKMYACTFCGGYRAVSAGQNVNIAKACYAGGSASTCWYNNTNVTMTDCASSDTSATGTNPHTSVAHSTTNFESVTDPHNYYLKVGSVLKDGAENHNPGEEAAPLNFTTDIVGTTRTTGYWDIGAFEYVAAGGLSIPVAMHHYRQLERSY